MLTKLKLSAFDINSNFEKIASENPDLKLELSATGELIIMSPTGGETGRKNADLTTQVFNWNKKKKLGVAFDSSTCFRLPTGALRSPDVSWISKNRWESLSNEQQKKFPPITPDFIIELMSESDSLKETQEKMAEYMAAGVRLGWLINPNTKQVEIYRNGRDKEVKENLISLSGEDVLPDFVLDLSEI